MAALDPRFEVRFDAGAPTVPHLNAAAGSLWLHVDPSHWLYVASGGDMPASPLHPGRFRVSWTDMWGEFLKFTPIDAALHANLVVRTIGSLRFFHDGFQRAVADGLDFSARGSFGAAKVVFVEFCTSRVQVNPTPWALISALVQNLPAPPAGHAALPAGGEF